MFILDVSSVAAGLAHKQIMLQGEVQLLLYYYYSGNNSRLRIKMVCLRQSELSSVGSLAGGGGSGGCGMREGS